MILIRRKSDGKYYRNPSYRQAIHKYTNFSKYKEWYGNENNKEKELKEFEDARWSFNIDDCKPFKNLSGAKSARDLSRSKFDEFYEVVPIEIHIQSHRN